jgi:hypothetical protein
MPNDKRLKPDDFPVEVEGEELVTAAGKPIAKAKRQPSQSILRTVSTRTITAKSRTDGRLDVARGRGEAVRPTAFDFGTGRKMPLAFLATS